MIICLIAIAAASYEVAFGPDKAECVGITGVIVLLQGVCQWCRWQRAKWEQEDGDATEASEVNRAKYDAGVTTADDGSIHSRPARIRDFARQSEVAFALFRWPTSIQTSAMPSAMQDWSV